MSTPSGSKRPLFNQEKPLRELKEQRGNPAHIGGEIQREREIQRMKNKIYSTIFYPLNRSFECKVDNKAVKVVKFCLAIIYQLLSPQRSNKWWLWLVRGPPPRD